MHFNDFESPEQCLAHDDPGYPWNDMRKRIFQWFCEEYDVACHAGLDKKYWLGPSRNGNRADDIIFDHTDIWFTQDGGIVASSCPYEHIGRADAEEYARMTDQLLGRLRKEVGVKPADRMAWLRSVEGERMRDHVHYYPVGYHHDKTVLIVIDTVGMKLLRILDGFLNRS